jgi:hypothetical protein
MRLMPRLFGSPRFASLVLGAFIMAQPLAGCAALCLVQRHHASHLMAGMDGGSTATSRTTCHSGVTDADHITSIQVLSPMEPATDPVLAELPSEVMQPLDVRPILPPQISSTPEPPPPRSV